MAEENKNCFHCGLPCKVDDPHIGEKLFCCNGCKMVYEFLEANDLCRYYALQSAPGRSSAEAGLTAKFAYLEDETTVRRLIHFSDGQTSTVTFTIPAMHCISCVWLLENLPKINPLIISSRVDFLRKELTLTYHEQPTALRQIVELLASIGYMPQLNLASLQKERARQSNKDLYLKIGVAGFCFANIMLLSFPDYLATSEKVEAEYQRFFSYLSVFLSLPVLLFSSAGYFTSAFGGIKQRFMNMDIPISLGILAMFARSLYDVFLSSGTGYFDSFTGLVFFLLIGKLFERKTYETLSFERDYKSYFPLSVNRKQAEGEQSIPLEKLCVNDRIIIRNRELIPADSVLIQGQGWIDYSFVTGEAKLVSTASGDLLYAGGRQSGAALEVEVVKEVDQSYLTRLWNEETFKKEQSGKITSAANRISKYFTAGVLAIALAAFLFWLPADIKQGINAFTAVLIVACPCALALSTPLTLGNALRIMGRNKFYLKNTGVIEQMAQIDALVFDKTGTITRSAAAGVEFQPAGDGFVALSEDEIDAVHALVKQSTHPLSQQLAAALKSRRLFNVENFKETVGQGISGFVNGQEIRLGSAEFISAGRVWPGISPDSRVFVAIDSRPAGSFRMGHVYRRNLRETIQSLAAHYQIQLISGDDEGEKKKLLIYFGNEANLRFRMQPIDKLNFIKHLQDRKKRVLMIGDGLNDAGALSQSDVGVAIAEDVTTFTPASDAILEGGQFDKLPKFLKFSRQSMRVIKASFLLSFFYNLIGLSFAVSGALSPLIAAILMPLSSISVIAFTTGATALLARRLGLSVWNN